MPWENEKKNLLIKNFSSSKAFFDKDKIKTFSGKSRDNLLLANMQYKSPSG